MIEPYHASAVAPWRKLERERLIAARLALPADYRAMQSRAITRELGYRLGYGGGFFDRTLAQLVPLPHVIGIGYPEAAIETIYPQPYDIPMQGIVNGLARPTAA